MQEIYLFSMSYRLALGCTQHLFSGFQVLFSPGAKASRLWGSPLCPPSASVKNVYNYTTTIPVCFYGVEGDTSAIYI